jgi:hypothetical protein
MKKIIFGISLITFVLFAFSFNADANVLKQDKQKVAVEKKATNKTAEHKCCAGDKKSDAKCCSDSKKTDAKKADVKCGSKSDCSSKCSDTKKTAPKQ